MRENQSQPKRRGAPDFQLLILTVLLVGFGLVMVFSASSSIAVISKKFNYDSLYFVKKQLMWAGLGFIVMMIAMNIRYEKYKKLFIPFFILTIILLALVPFVGVSLNGARSWFGVGSVGIQPTELAKITTILYLAALISKKGETFRDFKKGFLPVIMIVGFIAFLIMLQPDFGSCMILVGCCGIVIIAGGANLKHIFACVVVLGIGAGIGMVVNMLFNSSAGSGYKAGRISSFLNPWSDPQGTGFHLLNSLKALGHGGLTGAGFGQSIQKLHYLPYPYNDFIFAVIGEELGFIGSALFLIFYLYFIWRGLIVALRCPDRYGTLVGVGIMGLIAIQTFINIGGVSQTIPITGVTLPFISYGGSSLLIMLGSIGILLSISREANRPEDQSKNAKNRRFSA
ncbi:putative lipid II flippase FtsW [Paenibacillus selenitireducens]|uniref:Probable peptidoglycan glycosyltransferase FtsW n=1 Tax=Paenibacillus selenitireducens TaxID=1324314 RepID=A0A1T2XFC9_9BACL|nr:putative lipid II flippase FtsW [Paenibacillus selenitireducens]OPA78560.1 putative lipid II flippase FtsW [Paenibacillus selenitireducens]